MQTPYDPDDEYAQWYAEGWYQDEHGEWYQDSAHARGSASSSGKRGSPYIMRPDGNRNAADAKRQHDDYYYGERRRPDNYEEGWYTDENGEWLNEFDWHQDENGEWYYEDSSYDHDYEAEGWRMDEYGEWYVDEDAAEEYQRQQQQQQRKDAGEQQKRKTLTRQATHKPSTKEKAREFKGVSKLAEDAAKKEAEIKAAEAKKLLQQQQYLQQQKLLLRRQQEQIEAEKRKQEEEKLR